MRIIRNAPRPRPASRLRGATIAAVSASGSPGGRWEPLQGQGLTSAASGANDFTSTSPDQSCSARSGACAGSNLGPMTDVQGEGTSAGIS
jgi:hypothetical protein